MGNRPEEHVAEGYNIKAGIWDLYRTNNAWDNIPVDISNIECENLLDDLYYRCDEAASASIPKMTIRKFFPKPYWTQNQQETSCCGKNLELNIESCLGTRNESTGFN